MMGSLGSVLVRLALVVATLTLVGCELATRPSAPTSQPVVAAPSKDAQAWELGNRISLAAIGNAEQGPPDAIQNVFAKAQTSASELGVPPLPPLPGRMADRSRGGAEALNYLLKTAGAPIARSLEEQGSRRASLLFQISLKANLLLLLYEPSPNNSEAAAIIGFITDKGTEIGLPKDLSEPLASQVRSRASHDQVKSSVQQFQERVHAHLLGSSAKVAGPPPVNAFPSPNAPTAAPAASSPRPAAPQSPAAGERYLRSLTPAQVEVIQTADHALDRSFEVQQVTFSNGVHIHPPLANSTGRATYALGGGFVRLRGAAGVSDHRFGKAWSSLTFRVLGDGKTLWTSKPLQTCGDWEAYDIDVTGVNQLTLEVQCAGEHTGAHGSWMDPILVSANR